VAGTNDMNSVAAMGFQDAAHIYDQARPSYPNEAIKFLKSLCSTPTTIVDLGAGTGKLTRLLSAFGAQEIIAIEPVSAMREHLQLIPSITRIIAGTAEHILLEDNTVDVIFCGQSFHWFANERALTEIHRVLKPNGLLVLIWNTLDYPRYSWSQQILELINSYQPPEVPRYRSMKWKSAYENQNLFPCLQHKQFANIQHMTRETVINRFLSVSFIAVLPSEEKEKFIMKMHQIIDRTEDIREQTFDAPYLTDVYWSCPQK
jgi:ubiquinone/menaquinone biosynthesis C-methylase UbiE